MPTIAIPVAVRAQDHEVLLAGQLNRARVHAVVDTCRHIGEIAAYAGSSFAQWRGSVEAGTVKLLIPARFLATAPGGGKIIYTQIAAGEDWTTGINGDEADAICIIQRRKTAAGGGLHHAHTGPVIGIPVGKIDALFGIGTSGTRAIQPP